MPIVTYYQGRPASFWIAAMAGPARRAAANQADGACPTRRQPAAPPSPRRAPAGASAFSAATAHALQAWAANWFTPDRRSG
jgi:hypothetical protein